jgi:hypothetical protein
VTKLAKCFICSNELDTTLKVGRVTIRSLRLMLVTAVPPNPMSIVGLNTSSASQTALVLWSEFVLSQTLCLPWLYIYFPLSRKRPSYHDIQHTSSFACYLFLRLP